MNIPTLGLQIFIIFLIFCACGVMGWKIWHSNIRPLYAQPLSFIVPYAIAHLCIWLIVQISKPLPYEFAVILYGVFIGFGTTLTLGVFVELFHFKNLPVFVSWVPQFLLATILTCILVLGVLFGIALPAASTVAGPPPERIELKR